MTPLQLEVIEAAAAKFYIAPQQITSRRTGHAVGNVLQARIEVAWQLCLCGYSGPKIATVLNRNHTTIMYYLGKLKGKPLPSAPRWRKPRVKHLNRAFRPSWYFPAPLLPVAKRPAKRRVKLIPYAGAER